MLKGDLQTKLRIIYLQINDEKVSKIFDIAERYIKTLTYKFNGRFISDIVEVLYAFSIFELGKVLCTAKWDQVDILCEYYFRIR